MLTASTIARSLSEICSRSWRISGIGLAHGLPSKFTTRNGLALPCMLNTRYGYVTWAVTGSPSVGVCSLT